MRMCKGEKNILVNDDIVYYGMTSGTTGKQKIIPMTKTGLKVVSKYMAILSQRFLYKNFKESYTYGKGLVLTDMTISGKTQSGKAICSATSGGMKSIKWVIPLIWSTPVEVMELQRQQLE